ncbi:MAG: Ig-like domain repeat protein [Nocardioides sp.]
MTRSRLAAALVAVGALVLAPQVLPAVAVSSPADTSGVVAPVARPPVGKAWLVGVVTDQAGHPLNDVVVEAWSTDPTASAPTATSLTYESDRRAGQNGFFNLEVPGGAAYVVVVSRPTDDAFRGVELNGGSPYSVGKRVERDLGTIEIAYTARQRSTTKARLSPAKVKAGKRTKVVATVTSKNVAPVLGKVTAVVGGKSVAGKLKRSSKGRITLALPPVKRPGTYTVRVSYLGDSFVKKSATKLKLTVKK